MYEKDDRVVRRRRPTLWLRGIRRWCSFGPRGRGIGRGALLCQSSPGRPGDPQNQSQNEREAPHQLNNRHPAVLLTGE